MTKKGTGKVASYLEDILREDAGEARRGDFLAALAKGMGTDEELLTKVAEASPQLADIPLWCEIDTDRGEMTSEGLILGIPEISGWGESDSWRQLTNLLITLKEKGLRLRFVIALDKKR
jgi:hypothetical protein